MTDTKDLGDQIEPMLQATLESSEEWFEAATKKRGLEPHPDPEVYLQWWTKQLSP